MASSSFRFTILTIGRLKSSPETDLVKRYTSRLNKAMVVVELDASSASPPLRKERETLALLQAIPTGAFPIALDERGLDLTTRAFHEILSDKAQSHGPHFAILIGGADGLDQDKLPPAMMRVCLGRMTWPHAMVRAMICEQLYRIIQLDVQHPYHRD